MPRPELSIEQVLNKKFGRLKIIKEVEQKNRQRMVKCSCDCGKEKIVRLYHLLSEETTSCGCYQKERASATKLIHGAKSNGKRSVLYVTWVNMKQRCMNPKSTHYKRYGGRGIKICDEWLNDFVAFHKWAIRSGYKKGLTIDRINNDGNYEPTNCQWLTFEENTKKGNRE